MVRKSRGGTPMTVNATGDHTAYAKKGDMRRSYGGQWDVDRVSYGLVPLEVGQEEEP